MDVWLICYKDVTPFWRSIYGLDLDRKGKRPHKTVVYLSQQAVLNAYPNAWAKTKGKVKIVRCRLLPKAAGDLDIESYEGVDEIGVDGDIILAHTDDLDYDEIEAPMAVDEAMSKLLRR